jgi:hypothetical protein
MAGRHVADSSFKTLWIADGVKGLLIASRLSLVVWALTSFAESLRTWRGFGGLSILVSGASMAVLLLGFSDEVNWVSKVKVDVIKSLRACESSLRDVDCAMSDSMKMTDRCFALINEKSFDERSLWRRNLGAVIGELGNFTPFFPEESHSSTAITHTPARTEWLV